MTHTSPPAIQPGRLEYRHQHAAARLPGRPVRCSVVDILAALPGGRHASPHAAEIADEIGLLMHNIDRLDAGRDAAGNLSPAGAVDYQGYGARILGLLRSINLYPVAAA